MAIQVWNDLHRASRTAAVGCLLAGGLISSAPAMAGCQNTSEVTAPKSTEQRNAPGLLTRPRYHIQSGDVLALSFPLSPEFDQTVTVTPDGYVALRSAGDLAVAGKSLPELREQLRKAYLPLLNDPEINVDLKDFQKAHFTVGGEVGHPGKYELREDISVTEAIAVAGGATTSAKSSQVLLFRPLPNGSMMEVRKLNMNRMIKKGDLSEDVRLQPGDFLFVPKTVLSTIERFLPTSSLGMYTTGMPF
jgi:polysaccharide export outer membrane protein